MAGEGETWVAATGAAAVAAEAAGAEAVGVAATDATAAGETGAAPPKPMRRSSLSIRVSEPSSVLSWLGTKTFAAMISSCNLGLVAPLIAFKPLAII